MCDGRDDPWAGWPPESTVFSVGDADLRILAGPHPILATYGKAIAANWREEAAANPALFDGQMVVQHRLRFEDGVIRGEGYLAPFSTFLWWRRNGRPAGALHLACAPVLQSCDGALIAVRMGAHTANAGRVYFAAGSLDASDIAGDRCDVAGNMRREVIEETGLDLGEAEADDYQALRQPGVVTLFRRFRFPLTAAEMLLRIAAFLETAPEPEIDGAVAITDADPAAHDYQPYMPVVLRHLLDGV